MRLLKKSSGISLKGNIGRIIDANLNRSQEGLRVCEEVVRFALDQSELTAELKALRHRINSLSARFYAPSQLLGMRQADRDVGKSNARGELGRKNLQDIFFANIQRAKEALRVLEECNKLLSPKAALSFKALRYKVYALEKKAFKRISALSDFRRA